jgi:uncharacterized protein
MTFKKQIIYIMKKILLISDTHSYIDPRMEKHLAAADEVWHAGDIGNLETAKLLESKSKKLRMIWGNIDDHVVRAYYQESIFFNCEQKKVVITHIAGYPKKYSAKAKHLIYKYKPDIFICGHSHILKVMYDKELNHLHMNPGACGNHGFHKVQTALSFQIHVGNITNLNIIEWERKQITEIS